jgi:predicted CXXCH cytochrome family protein
VGARLAATARLLLPLLLSVGPCLVGPDAVRAQVSRASSSGHSCMDCHLRKHEERMRVPEAMAGSGVGEVAPSSAFAGTLRPGHAADAGCLECHSSREQRAERAAESPDRVLTMASGAFLGLDLKDDHPLGDGRSRPTWSRDLLGGERPWGPREAVLASDRLVERTDPARCVDCHDLHDPFDSRRPPGSERVLCLGCHDQSYYAFRGHISTSCLDCHVMHDAPGATLLKARRSDDLCAACHQGAATFSDLEVDPGLHGPPGHDDVRVGRCSECHRIHGRSGG